MGDSRLSTTAVFSAAARWRFRAAVGFIFIATFVVYLPAINGDFIWDDDAHVTQPELRSLEGLYRIWFELGATQQHYPLLHSAFWTQHWLWGDSPTGYHVVNVLMHATVATLLMFVLLHLEFSRWAAFLAAGAFALHPVHVESVAWITELKNTLSGVFYLSAMLMYLRFDESRKLRHYFAALGLFVVGLLTKTVIATLPAALLVIFWWQRGRLSWKRDARPLLPWFMIGGAAGLFTAWVEYNYIGAQGEKFAFSALDRLLVAGRAVWFYLGKLVWPAELIFMYPRWEIDPGIAWQWLYPAALLALLIGLILLARHSKAVTAEGGQARRWRAPLGATLIFIGTLFPVLGFFNVYPFVFSFVADHFQYLASMSVIALIAGSATAAVERSPVSARSALRGGLLAPLVVLAVLSFRQSRMYADVMVLYETTLERNPTCWLAHNNLGSALREAGEREEAMRHFQRALELRPDYARAHLGLGIVYGETGRPQQALHHLQQAVRYQPRYPDAHFNMGLALKELGRTQEAITQFLEALREQADHIKAMDQLGVLYAQTGSFEKSITCFSRSLAINPHRPHIWMNLALAYNDAGRKAEAMAAAAKALEMARAMGLEDDAARYERWIKENR